MAGGNGGHKRVEYLNLDTGDQCELPSTDVRYGLTLDHDQEGELVVCGGCGHVYCQKQCLTLSEGEWKVSHQLLYQRYFHTSWRSAQGVLLIGGLYSHTCNTTELLTQDGGSVEKFSLKYPRG